MPVDFHVYCTCSLQCHLTTPSPAHHATDYVITNSCSYAKPLPTPKTDSYAKAKTNAYANFSAKVPPDSHVYHVFISHLHLCSLRRLIALSLIRSFCPPKQDMPYDSLAHSLTLFSPLIDPL